MRRSAIILVAVMLSLILIIGACAKPAPAPPPTPQPSPTPAPPPAETITLKFSTFTTAKAPIYHPPWTQFAKDVESRTNGRVKFEDFVQGTLIPQKEEVEGIGSGIADISLVLQQHQSRLSLLSVTTLPGVGGTMENVGPCLLELIKMKAIQDQFDKNNLKLLMIQGGAMQGLFMKNKPVRTIDDLKGMKIRALGDAGIVLNNLGAVPVGVATPEMFEAMERGTIDGVYITPVGGLVWKINETSKYYTDVSLDANVFYYIMNKDSWLALPEDIKQVFMEEAEKQPKYYYDSQLASETGIFNNVFPKNGIEVIHLSAADIGKISEASQPVWETWVKAREAEGLPGREVLNKWLALTGVKK